MAPREISDESEHKSRRWRVVYFAIVALTVLVYLLLWVFSQAFL